MQNNQPAAVCGLASNASGDIELGDHRCVVRWLLKFARLAVYPASAKALSCRRINQNMVYPQSGVPSKAELAVIPPAEGLGRLLELTEGVDQPRVDQSLEPFSLRG